MHVFKRWGFKSGTDSGRRMVFYRRRKVAFAKGRPRATQNATDQASNQVEDGQHSDKGQTVGKNSVYLAGGRRPQASS